MYRQCSSEKSVMQQRKFEACFLDTWEKEPYDNISISGLCRDAGMSRKTFYRLFECKSDVVFAMVDHIITDETFYVPDESVGPGDLHRFFAYWKSQKRFLDVLRKNDSSHLLTERAISHIFRDSPEVHHVFGTADSPIARETIIFYLSGMFTMVLDWHRHGFQRSIDEMAALVMTVLTTAPLRHADPTNK